MTFRSNLRRLRKAKGLTQEALGLACGWGQSRIANYEAAGENGRSPELDDVPKIADGLGVQIQELFGRPAAPSQSARLDPDVLRVAVETARAIARRPLDFERDCGLVADVYNELVRFVGKPVPPAVIVDLMRRLESGDGSK